MSAWNARLVADLRSWLSWRFPVLDAAQVHDAVQEGLVTAVQQAVAPGDQRMLRMIVWRVARRLWQRAGAWGREVEVEEALEPAVPAGQLEHLALSHDLPRARARVVRQIGGRQGDRLMVALEQHPGWNDAEVARASGLDRTLISRARRGIAAEVGWAA
jgi:hypothetical protein